MRKLVIATAAALLLGAPLALAANTTTNGTTPKQEPKEETTSAATLLSQCTALGKQFDQVKAKHKGDKNYKEAVQLRASGKKMCAAHKEADGVKNIETALNMIGVKPKM